MLTDRAKEYIRSLDDLRLAKYIATGELMYEPEAIEFACEEFSRRNIAPAAVDQLDEYARRQVDSEIARENAIASQPLDGPGKLLAFVVGIAGVGFLREAVLVWYEMERKREYQKMKDGTRYFLLGFAIHIIALTVLGVVMYSHWAAGHRHPS